MGHQFIGSLLFFGKIYLSAHIMSAQMITVLKQNRPLIYLHNVCISGAKALLRLHTQVYTCTEAQTFAARLCDKDYKFISWVT